MCEMVKVEEAGLMTGAMAGVVAGVTTWAMVGVVDGGSGRGDS